MTTINIMLFPAGSDALNIDVKGDNATLIEIVKGEYDVIQLPYDIRLLVNDKQSNLQDNFIIVGEGLINQTIKGNAVFMGLDAEDNPSSLTAKQIDKIISWMDSRILLDVHMN